MVRCKSQRLFPLQTRCLLPWKQRINRSCNSEANCRLHQEREVVEEMEEQLCRERSGPEMERFCTEYLGFRCLQRFLRFPFNSLQFHLRIGLAIATVKERVNGRAKRETLTGWAWWEAVMEAMAKVGAAARVEGFGHLIPKTLIHVEANSQQGD
ncbi:BAG family molecular chaperone regulator 5, mitochondrial-like protein [Corchorus capsularis]|uniref:BAG family molecular chaperone regulator 5, mitochondrial-like protein n=1 Tax=Corchorus capsularis TaxID=210143 RepID=A0A1R3FUV4_COCAP|nr:BAG family molecular chaperone regulator 5, mitochondrial-like protein [Corchorus capsularis]